MNSYNNNNSIPNKNNSFSNLNPTSNDELTTIKDEQRNANNIINNTKQKPQTAGGGVHQHQYESNGILNEGDVSSSSKQTQKSIPKNKVVPFKGANKIMISNDPSKFTHKKISKSPEIKSKEKI